MKRVIRDKKPVEMLNEYEDRIDEMKRQQGVVSNSTKVEGSYDCQYKVVPWRDEDELNLLPFLSYQEAMEAGKQYYPEGFDIEDYCPEDEDSESVEGSCDVKGSNYDSDESTWEKLESKSVKDSDGFWTDYTLYYDALNDRYVTVLGDSDLYGPEDGYFDAEFDSEAEAYEWFEDYDGIYDNDDEDIDW